MLRDPISSAVRLLPAALLAVLATTGCPAEDDPMSSDGGSETESATTAVDATDTDTPPSTTDGPPTGTVELGWGIDSFTPLQDGGEFRVVWGTQGAAMFPMPVRASGITLPDDPSDFLDPRAPKMNLELDIEGHNDGFGGHFKRIANYAMTFEVLDDGTYEFLYVAILIPDDKDPLELAGLPAHLWVEVTPYDSPPIVVEYDLTVVVDDPPG